MASSIHWQVFGLKSALSQVGNSYGFTSHLILGSVWVLPEAFVLFIPLRVSSGFSPDSLFRLTALISQPVLNKVSHQLG